MAAMKTSARALGGPELRDAGGKGPRAKSRTSELRRGDETREPRFKPATRAAAEPSLGMRVEQQRKP